ncbi:DUF427 domain-containing protein [Streptomyces chartreusis]|uniref:DUF427 domain-containing protein n=1 Tax=Streptomyces chartreusis TaxID=1969 RepID=UPI0033FC73C6
MLLHEPGRYPVAYFLLTDVAAGVLEQAEHTTHHRDLGALSWYPVRARGQSKQRAAWQHVDLPDYAEDLNGRVALAWRAVDGSFEEHDGTRCAVSAGWCLGMVSLEPDAIEVSLDGVRLRLEPGRNVVSHGVDRNLDLDEARGP